MSDATACHYAPVGREIPALRCGEAILAFGSKTFVMGILNVTPDSFSGDGLAGDVTKAVDYGLRLVEEGADLLDVGGESTRPGAEPVPLEQEINRVVPVIQRLLERAAVPISVDTRKSRVAREAVEAGATLINDISGLSADPEIAVVAAETGVGLSLMHIQGTPQTMQQDPTYGDVVQEILEFLEDSKRRAMRAGVAETQIVIDPGIGFGKTVDHNLEILRRLSEFRALGSPILIGTSRKSFIGKVLNLPVNERLEGTAATVALAISQGADIVRVHDVRVMSRVTRMCDAIVRRKSDDSR